MKLFHRLCAARRNSSTTFPAWISCGWNPFYIILCHSTRKCDRISLIWNCDHVYLHHATHRKQREQSGKLEWNTLWLCLQSRHFNLRVIQMCGGWALFRGCLAGKQSLSTQMVVLKGRGPSSPRILCSMSHDVLCGYAKCSATKYRSGWPQWLQRGYSCRLKCAGWHGPWLSLSTHYRP